MNFSTLVKILQIPQHCLLLETDCPDATPKVDKSWSMQDVVPAKNREIEECAEVHGGERECGESNISGKGWYGSEISGCNHPANIIAVSDPLPCATYGFPQDA